MIYEFDILKPLIETFRRSPLQLNDFFQSDSEILKFENSKLAITTDTIIDEIDIGIYDDPYEIGFISVMSSVSDLTASGASPLGILSNVELPTNFDPKKQSARLFEGIEEACKLNDTYVLGGDTNWSDRLRVGTVGIGSFSGDNPVMRTGLSAGDILLSSGEFGGGNANAINRLMNNSKYPETLLPKKIVQLRPLISKYATSAIDTSDGLFMGISTLGQLNGVDFRFFKPFNELIQNDCLKITTDADLPPWFVLAGPVGEYELVFTVPNKHERHIIHEASENGINLIEIGLVVEKTQQDCSIHFGNKIIEITSMINDVQSSKSDLKKIIKTLYSYETLS